MPESAPRRTTATVVAILAAVLAAAVAVAYAPVAGAGFVAFDDPEYVYDNPVVRQGLTAAGWRHAWTETHAANWHPLTWLSHMLDVTLFGVAPGPHHLVNVGLHAASAVLLFALVRRWIGATAPAFLAAAVFALHPLRVESVAWISERKDVLSGVFFLLTLHAWTSWTRAPRAATYALALVAFALGLLAKSMLVTLPFLLLVLDVWPFARTALGARRLVVEKLPFLALAAAASVATWLAQSTAGAVATSEGFPLAARLANAVVSFARYVGMTVWPADLSVHYPLSREVHAGATVAAAVALIAATGWIWTRRAASPWLLAGWLWYLGTLVPVIGIVQVGRQSHADRYTYLTTIGLVVAVAAEAHTRLRSAGVRKAAGAAAVVVLVVLGARTRAQAALWQDTRTLFTHAVRVTPENVVPRSVLGSALFRAGDADGAVREFTEAVRIEPAFPGALNNLGSALGAQGRFPEAIRCFRRAIELGVDTPGVRTNLGWALLQTGERDEAEREARRGVEAGPDDAQARAGLGFLLRALGRTGPALDELREAVRLGPDALPVRRAFAATLLDAGRDAEAAAEFGEVLARAPDDAEALRELAWIRATSSDATLLDPAAARDLALRAARAGGDDPRVLEVVAAALAANGDFDGALREAGRALAMFRARGVADAEAALGAQMASYRVRRPFRRTPTR